MQFRTSTSELHHGSQANSGFSVPAPSIQRRAPRGQRAQRTAYSCPGVAANTTPPGVVSPFATRSATWIWCFQPAPAAWHMRGRVERLLDGGQHRRAMVVWRDFCELDRGRGQRLRPRRYLFHRDSKVLHGVGQCRELQVHEGARSVVEFRRMRSQPQP